MGKKSLIKSTSKKKRAPKNAAAKTKPNQQPPAKKAAPGQSKTADSSAKKPAPKKAAPKTQPVSVKDLLKKQFDTVTPKVLYTVPPNMESKQNFEAPEFLSGYSNEEAHRIKGILANTYSEKDLKAAAEKAAGEKAAADKAAAEKAAAEKAAADKAAADKAAADKAAADKAAADKAAADKTAAEKAAAEKAAADKAAAEKAAADKAAADKADADKAAADKAAAEKAAADKAAAEKAAAEKAAADRAAADKAVAEKVAADKAAAEKAAAEKADAIRKAAAQRSDVSVTYEPEPAAPTTGKPADPVDNSIKLLAAGLAFLILMVIGASTSNSFKYYLEENQGALEVWKGKFAPLGRKMIMALPGVQAPETANDVYRSGDVDPLIFNYYLDKADALLEVPGIPDFEGIKATLNTALEYGSTRELRTAAYDRLDNIDRLILVYKADVAASRGTIEDLESAIGYLKDAGNLTSDPTQEEMIARKIASHETGIALLEEQAAAERAAAEAEVQAAQQTQAADDQETEAEAGTPEPSDEPDPPEAEQH